ncbi:hypothetical protein MRQ36_12990 [Micromonospora sp. R77]|uniref:hypothetical protein n=1 Tax=Micromonospora sp. R77 TaxID=2925836 RepID=UPI001F612F1C|nr:hypothetical protein [Micromonospora sp. R77]MCI4063443.1 hypothetical protein [Micromonospora sp. R77]
MRAGVATSAIMLRLGGRLSIRPHVGATAHRIALVVASAVAFLTVWVFIGAHLVATERGARVASREPIFTTSAGGSYGFWVARADFVDDKQITIIYIDPGRSTLPAPPGLDGWPRPGEAYLSPALRSDMPVRDGTCVYGRLAGIIKPAGLSDPNEKIAYIRPRDSTVFARYDGPARISGFGRVPTDDYPAYSTDRAGRTIGEFYWLTIMVLAVPTILLLLIAARSNAELRDRRLAMLDALGAPTSSRIFLIIGEAVGAAAVGTLLGAITVALAMWHGVRIPIIDYSVRGSDLATGLILLPFTALGFTGFVALFCLAAQIRSRKVAGTRPNIIHSRLQGWPSLVFLVAFAILIWISTTAYQGGGVPFFSRRTQGFLLTLVIVIAALPATIASITSPLGRAVGYIGARRGWPSALIGGRWIAERPTALARMCAATVVGLALLTLSQALVSQAANANQPQTNETRADRVISIRTTASTEQEVSRFREAIGSGHTLTVYQTPHEEPVIVAACPALAALGRLGACVDSSLTEVELQQLSPLGTEVLDRGASILIDRPARLLTQPSTGASIVGLVILNDQGSNGVQAAKAQAFRDLAFPGISTIGQYGVGGDTELALVYTWLWAFLLPGMAILLIASLVSAIDTFLLQARTLGFLGSLTQKTSLYFSIALWSILLPLTAAALGGAGVAAILGNLFVKLRATGHVHLSSIAFGVLAISIFAVALTWACAVIGLRSARRWSPSSD